jgi:hypothetical protein
VAAPPASEVPPQYDTLLPGKERPRQKKLDWWDRFQVADGVIATVARSAVAVGIVGSVIAVGGAVGSATVTIYNGLGTQVSVSIAEQEYALAPHGHREVTIPSNGNLQVRTLSRAKQVIEEFEESLGGANANYVYNVASAAPLVEWTAVYTPEGGAAPNNDPNNHDGPKERTLGTPRWLTTDVDYLFVEPPQHIQLDKNKSRAFRTALSSLSHSEPWRQTEDLGSDEERARLILTHARWDDTKAQQTQEWMQLASGDPRFAKLLDERVRAAPADVVLLRLEQDTTTGEAHAAACARHRELAASKPRASLEYLAIRCLDDEEQRNAAFIAAQENGRTMPGWPWPRDPPSPNAVSTRVPCRCTNARSIRCRHCGRDSRWTRRDCAA